MNQKPKKKKRKEGQIDRRRELSIHAVIRFKHITNTHSTHTKLQAHAWHFYSLTSFFEDDLVQISIMVWSLERGTARPDSAEDRGIFDPRADFTTQSTPRLKYDR